MAIRGRCFCYASFGPESYYREQLIRMGHEEAVTVVRHAWEEGGHTAGIAAVPDALVDSLFFAGPVEACVERLEA